MAQPLTGGLFRLGETLGTGARATVYAGTHIRTGRPLAFKAAGTPEGNAALLAEWRALRTVRHPNIVAAHGLIRLEDGRCALVLDRAPGRPLAFQTELTDPQRSEVALALTRAVCALHGRGIVHGDISPANVLVDVGDRMAAGERMPSGPLPAGIRTPSGPLPPGDRTATDRTPSGPLPLPSDERTPSGPLPAGEPTSRPIGGPDLDVRVSLIDPGLGREAAGVDGTVGYLAPEVLGGGPRTFASDLYSLGCVLYELLETTTPFPGELDRITHQHLHAEPTPATRWSGTTRSLLQSLLAKDPAGRPATAEHVLGALAAAFGRDPEVEFVSLAQALLASTPQPAVPPSWRPRLEQAVEALMAGRGGFFVLVGEEGSGRSAVGDELLATAAAQGAWPRRVVDPADGLFATPSGSTGPVVGEDPVMVAVRRLARRPSPQVIVVDAPREEPAALARVAEVLQTAARTMPLLGLMIVDSGRAVAPEAPHLTLEPLSAATTVSFLREWLGLEEDARQRIEELFVHASIRTPAAARALLREALARGMLVRSPGAWALDRPRLDAEVDDLVRSTASWTDAQLRAQPPLQRRVLAAVALLERPAARATIVSLTSLSPPDVERALWGLEAEGFLRVAGDGRAQPAHRSLGEAAIRILGPRAAAALHLGAAALPDEHLGHDLAPTERTWHRVLAGEKVETVAVLAAAEQLLELGAPTRTLRLLDAGEALTPTPVAARRAVAHLRSRALETMGDLPESRAVLEGALAAGPDEGLSLALCDLLVRQGEFREALIRLEGLGDSPQARLDRARALHWTGRYDKADELARGLVDDPGLPAAMRAAALHVRATCAWHRGDLPSAERLAADGLARVGHTDRAVRADLLRGLGSARYYRGNMGGAREVLIQALAENRALARVPEIAKTLNNLAMVLYSMGDWHGAAGLWDEFRLICARLGDPVELAHAHNNLGFLTIRLGDPERAATLFRACIEQAREVDYQRIVPIAQANLGEAMALCGDITGAERAMAEAEVGLSAIDAQLDLMELQRRRAELDLLRGRPDDALARVGFIGAEFQPEVAPLEAAHLQRITAAAHRMRDRPGDAETLARAALQGFEEQGARYEAALAREELGRCLQALGRVVEANRLASEALDTFRFLGARRDQERASTLVRELTWQTQTGHRFARHGEILLDVALHFGSTLDLEQLLPRVLARLVDLLNAERGLVALFDADLKVQRAVTHNLAWAGPGTPLPVSQSLLDEVTRQGRAVIVDDVHVAGQAELWKSVQVLGVRSMVGMPLQARGGQIMGLLYFDTQTHLADDPQEAVELLTGITRLLGTAVENARLFREERFRAELLADMAHHFRTPLSVISANAEVIADEVAKEPELHAMADDVVANAQRLYRMVDHTLELARVESSSRTVEPERIDLVAALDKHLNAMHTLARGQGLSLRLEGPRGLPPVHTIPDRLWIVVDNLVFNAMKFAREGSTVVLTVSRRPDRGPPEATARVLAEETDVFRHATPVVADPSTGFLEVTVHDDGRPVPAELRDKLFDRYQYGERTARGVKSTGLGLSIVAQCARHLGGAVWLDLATDTSTRVAFTLPLGTLKPG